VVRRKEDLHFGRRALVESVDLVPTLIVRKAIPRLDRFVVLSGCDFPIGGDTT
jgi:hypothetical protein